MNWKLIGILGVIALVLGVVTYTYIQSLSMYQVPSYSFTSGKLWTYTGTKTDNSAPDHNRVEITESQSYTFSNFYWQKYTKAASLFDVYWKAKTDLRVDFGVSGSELVQTYGSWSKNFTGTRNSNDTTTVTETTWWVHRFKGYVYFTITGNIEIQLEEYNPTWDPDGDDMEWICNTIQEWTRLKDSKVRFRVDAPDILGSQSDFHGLIGMWVKDYSLADFESKYSSAYIAPQLASEEIILRDENGDPLIWSFPYDYEPDSKQISELAYNPSDVLPQYAYFDIDIVDLGCVPHWEKGYEGQWQFPTYYKPKVKLIFYVDVISTHNELFTVPDYEVNEDPPIIEGEGDQYEPSFEELDNYLWLIIVVVMVAIVVLLIIYYIKERR